MSDRLTHCQWYVNDELMIKYHDNEFGSFRNYIWGYVDNISQTYESHINGDIPKKMIYHSESLKI